MSTTEEESTGVPQEEESEKSSMSEEESNDEYSESSVVHFGHEVGYTYSGAALRIEKVRKTDQSQGFYVAPAEYIIGHRYQIRSMIGRGTFGLVYSALDLVTQKCVALKVLKENQGTNVQEELELNTILSKNIHPGAKIMLLKDSFYHNDHLCLVFDLCGHSALSLIDFFDTSFVGIPLGLVKKIVKDTLLGLDYMHKKGMIHTDLKPENIMSNRPLYQYGRHPGDDTSELFNCLEDDPNTVDFLLSDIGNSCYVRNPVNTLIQTRQYRAPEILLGHTYDTSTDIWSLACVAFELVVRGYLFNPLLDDSESETPETQNIYDAIHLSLIEDIMRTSIPLEWAKEGTNYDNIYEDDELIKRHDYDNVGTIYEQLLEKGLSAPEAEEFTKFLEPMLEIIPARRPTAEEVLQSPWLHRI